MIVNPRSAAKNYGGLCCYNLALLTLCAVTALPFYLTLMLIVLQNMDDVNRHDRDVVADGLFVC